MSTFEGRQPGLHPTRLAGPWGRRWGAAFGAQKDLVVAAAKLAVKSGFVRLAPADALPRHAADAALPLLPGETDEQLRTRVAAAWDFWPTAGTLAGLETAADLLGYVDRTIRTARALERDPWAQWFLFVADHGITRTRTWGAPDAWGAGVWGSDASQDYARRVRGLLRLVSNARDRGWVVLSLSTPGWWGSGTWGAPSTWGGKNIRWKV